MLSIDWPTVSGFRCTSSYSRPVPPYTLTATVVSLGHPFDRFDDPLTSYSCTLTRSRSARAEAQQSSDREIWLYKLGLTCLSPSSSHPHPTIFTYPSHSFLPISTITVTHNPYLPLPRLYSLRNALHQGPPRSPLHWRRFCCPRHPRHPLHPRTRHPA